MSKEKISIKEYLRETEKRCHYCDPKDEHIIPDDRSTTRISRPCAGCGKHQTIAGALLKSPQWRAWRVHVRKNELKWDVDETQIIDAMSDEHFRAFIYFLEFIL